MRPALTESPCWKCGSYGHFAHNCPRYLTEDELTERLDAWKQAAQKSGEDTGANPEKVA